MPEGKSHAEDDVLQGRATIFSLLLARLRFLHSNRTVPSSHYVGKDYVEDKRRVKCIISATFLFPGEVDPFHFWLHQTKVDGVQYGNALVVTALREISAQLWEDLRLKDDGQAFIIGYLTSLMPAVNRRLINNRYNKGHLLSRTFAIFEAVDVSITVAGRRLWLSWPPSLPSFPPTTELAGIQTPLYVRDYIDSISAYYRYEYDDAIRRVITATENFLDNHGWKVSAGGSGGVLHWIMSIFRRKPQGSSFRRRLRDNLDLSKISNEVVHDNLQFVYSIRNRIVHNGFRMSDRSGAVCDKAICSLYYLIYNHSGDMKLSEYVFTLHQQFALQKLFFGQMYDLDKIAVWGLADRSGDRVLEADEDIDIFMFESLRITDHDRQIV